MWVAVDGGWVQVWGMNEDAHWPLLGAVAGNWLPIQEHSAMHRCIDANVASGTRNSDRRYRYCLLDVGKFDGGSGPSCFCRALVSKDTSLCRTSATSQGQVINTAGVAARAQSTSQCSHSIHKLADNTANFFWHGCREHHHLLLSWALHEQALDIFAHICTASNCQRKANI